MKRVRKFTVTFFLLISLSALLASCGDDSITGVKSGRFSKPIVMKIANYARPYAGVMQNSLKQVGIPVEIETVETNTLFDQLRNGQFQLTTARWVGGNQDPVFLKDLFVTGAAFNRGRYSNPELDRILNEAANTADREQARALYAQAQEIISREVPMLPLWYPSQMVVARKSVGNIKVESNGDWGFMRNLTNTESKKGQFVVALESAPETIEQLRGTDASSERLRQLMYNTLVRKNEKLEYVGELASNIQRADDGLTYTFTLRDGVKFHNGRALTADDVKYTLDTLLASDSRKAVPFFEGTGASRQSLVEGVEAKDARTLVIRLRKPWLQLLTNLTPVGIIPQGTAGSQKQSPVGSGPFRFVRHDESQQMVDLAANEQYWQGAPAIKSLRVRVVLDSNTLQAELKSGGVDLAVVANLSPDAYKALAQDANLKVEQFPGANVVYLGFNVEGEPLKDARVRRAIAYAIDREGIVRDLLLGQARVAHSILPGESWAYATGEQYTYDPAKAKQLLDEAGAR
jgi:ABC-type transport system substrate-binding protein